VRFCPSDGQALVPVPAGDDLVGQLIGDRYRVVSRLGEGGMGQVFLADHVKMGRQSALKVLGRGLMSDPEAISRFNREAANAARISHPNVCAVYDFGETADGRLYLAMEYVQGRTLQQLLHDEGPLPLPRAALLLEQAAAALAAAHEMGIVHRDLKPDNIMITSVKGREVVKVVDFGIAKAAGAGDQQVTRTGFVIGTPDYMSPEQLAGDPVDARTDIYALALVFFRMVTGALPFDGATGQDSLVKRLTHPPRRLADTRPGAAFPSALQAVLDRALARQPAERYVSAPDFSRGVSRVVEAGRRVAGIPGSEITPSAAMPAARPPFASGAKRRVRQRSRLGRVLTIVVLLALAAGGAAYAHSEGLLAGWLDTLTRVAGFGAPAARAAVPTGAVAAPLPADTSAGSATLLAGDSLGAESSVREPRSTPPRRSITGAPVLGRPVSQNDGNERTDPAAVAALAAGIALTDSAPDPAGRAAGALSLMRDSLHVARLQPAIRARSALIFDDASLPDTTRAEAAVLVARVAYAQLGYGTAREWLLRALRLSPRQEYRDMLEQLPDGGTP
jgi:hypothetical protein